MPDQTPSLTMPTLRTESERQPMRVLLAGPRGFCAGVDRAIRVVEEAIRRFGAPVYVRHEIVHNRTVVEQLEAQGAIFVEELDEVPGDAPVVFSAHGVPKSVPFEAERRHLLYLAATCPLVSKVHREAERGPRVSPRDGAEAVQVDSAGQHLHTGARCPGGNPCPELVGDDADQVEERQCRHGDRARARA